MTTRAIVALALTALLSGCSRPSPQASSTGSTAPPQTPQEPPAAVSQIASAARPAPPVLFIGLDGADWQLLDDYMARGLMPNLSALVKEGTSGGLKTIRPPLSPLVWTTMMTGKAPIDHGILDFAQFDPASGAKEPITSASRRVPAIWNMASDAGKRVDVFGLWATYPAERVNGLMVSDRLFTFLFTGGTPPAGIVYPENREAWARDALAQAEKTTDLSVMQRYLPWLSDAEYQQHEASDDPYANPISALRRILIQTKVYDTLGRDAFARDHANLTIVYFEGTDSIGHVFAPYAPPRQAVISQADYDRYSQVPQKYFEQIDRQLGEYRKLAADAHAILMLASDHGFYWKDGRPETLSSNATATAAKWHRDTGMYLLWGPGIKAGGHDKEGSVQQVCATLLALAGLPPGQALLGPPLPGTPAGATTTADYAASFHPPTHPTASAATASDSADTLKKLKSLGYIGDNPSEVGTRGDTRTPGSYNNEGVIDKEAGKKVEAAAAFEKALSADPNLASAAWNLSDLLFGNPQTADRSDELLVRAFANGLPEGTKLLIGRAIGYQRAGEVNRSLTLVNGGLQAKPDVVDLWLFRGRYRVEANDCAGAVQDFKQAEALQPDDAAAYASEGLAQMCVGNPAAARVALTRFAHA